MEDNKIMNFIDKMNFHKYFIKRQSGYSSRKTVIKTSHFRLDVQPDFFFSQNV